MFKKSEINKLPLTFVVKGKTPDMNIAVKYPAFYGTEFPIHGLYENYSNYLFIKEGDQPYKKYQINTRSIVIPLVRKKNGSSEKQISVAAEVRTDILSKTNPLNQDLFFVSMPLNGPIIGYDRKGDIRYFYSRKGSKANVIRMSYDGDGICFVMIDNNKYYQKMDLFGNFIFREKMNVHHDIIPYKNGYELILGNSVWGWEDSVYILNKSKKIVRKLSIGEAIRKVVDKNDISILNQVIFDDKNPYLLEGHKKKIDWAHGNSLLYDHRNDLLYISLRHQGIVAINMSLWQLEFFIASDHMKIAPGTIYGKKPKESKYLTNIPSLHKKRCEVIPKGYEPRGQHAFFLRRNGEILFFDNQADNEKGTESVSRILQYKINIPAKQAHVTWQFVHPEKAYTRFTSDVDVTRDGNVLLLYGYGKPNRILEIDRVGKILYELIVKGKSVFYRVDKFPLYPYANKSLLYNDDQTEESYSPMLH